MPRRPTPKPPDPPDAHRQREFEPPERAALRDVRDGWDSLDAERKRRAWLAGLLRKAFTWLTGTLALVLLARDQIVDVVSWIGSLFRGGGA